MQDHRREPAVVDADASGAARIAVPAAPAARRAEVGDGRTGARGWSKSRRRLLAAGATVAALIGIGSTSAVRTHVRAAVLLARFAEVRSAASFVARASHEVDEAPLSFEGPGGAPIEARMYVPRHAEHAPAVVIAHGVHRLGIDEPRLVRFARAIAATGVIVLTPELQDLADYRIEPRSVGVLGAAAHALRARMGGHRVGLMGMSFAGGLCLLAAASASYADDVGFVVSVGGHDDLSRVLHFFATNAIATPEGGVSQLAAHPYGALVLAYGHAERFFAPEDVDIAREALRLWLWEKRDEARARAQALGLEGRATITHLFDGDVAAVTPAIEALSRDIDATGPVSPHGNLGGMRAPVFLLHGAGDTVIPAVETEWLASELPPNVRRRVLVSPAIVHVELDHQPTMGQSWALVDFMASVLEQADTL